MNYMTWLFISDREEEEEEECLFDQMFFWAGDLQLWPTRGRYHAGQLCWSEACLAGHITKTYPAQIFIHCPLF